MGASRRGSCTSASTDRRIFFGGNYHHLDVESDATSVARDRHLVLDIARFATDRGREGHRAASRNFMSREVGGGGSERGRVGRGEG